MGGLDIVSTNAGDKPKFTINEHYLKAVRELRYSHPMVLPDRPSVEDVMFSLAFDVSKRSPDPQTNVGCVITTSDFRVLSTGYNGYPRDIDYSLLPNTRPDKYRWMMHAERNALAWCQTRPEDGIAFLTHQSCFDCLTALWQHGIKTVYEVDCSTGVMDERVKEERDLFIYLSRITVHPRKMKDSWLK
jgi:deoxycytidylate deaminase